MNDAAGGLRAGFLVALSLQQQERRRREHEKGRDAKQVASARAGE